MTMESDILTLQQLQAHFSAALRYQEPAGCCPIETTTFSPDEKMQIYRNNYVMSLTEVLAATYPLVQLLIGEECFMQLARHHVLSFPPQQGNIWGYGHDFSRTIEETAAVISAVPYLAEIARLEWLIDTLERRPQPDTSPAAHQPLEQLSQVEAAKQPLIQLVCIQDMLLFRSPFAVFSIRHAVNTASFAGIEPEQAEQGVIVLVSGEITAYSLNSQAYQLLTELHNHAHLGEIAPDLLTGLNELVELGLVVGFTLGEKTDEHKD
jgi:hypothetical protein